MLIVYVFFGDHMGHFIYVDNSNLWVEGKRISAIKSGKAENLFQSQEDRVVDSGWNVNFYKLYRFLKEDIPSLTICKAVLFASTGENDDTVWCHARRAGFQTVLHPRNERNHEKKIDTDLVATVMQDSYERIDPVNDVITLTAGDSDYVPLLEKLVARGFVVQVVFWTHAAGDLRRLANRFVPLDQHLGTIGACRQS